ncbi:MAG: hypothetical protein M0C28_21265 [Candidatus Moduliflexus flocculans]|nr:hypothetical protein [Candidatus Moduliflexus flocculans]
MFDDSGKVVLVIEHIRDISERKRSEERLAKINEVFLGFGADPDENINRLVALCGEQLHAVCALYNRFDNGWLKAVGHWNTLPDFPPQDKPEGHICHDVLHDSSETIWVLRDLPATAYAETDPNVMRYGRKTYVGKAVSFDGVNIGTLCLVYQHDYNPSEDEKQLLGIVVGAIAIEEKRKHAEDDIRLLNAELEKGLRNGLPELEIANHELEAFNYSVSHDLHTPLMILEGFSESSAPGTLIVSTKNGRYYLERIQFAGRRMEGLIDAILRLSSLSRCTIQRENVDPRQMALLLASDLRQREPERSVEFIIEPDLFGVGDKRLLKIALENLIGNAWQHTSKTEAPAIEFGCRKQNDERAFVTCDNGVGFSMQRAGFLAVHPLRAPPFPRGIPGARDRACHGKTHRGCHYGGRLWGERRAPARAPRSFLLCRKILSSQIIGTSKPWNMHSHFRI